MKRILSLSILLLATCNTSLFAWGDKGHALVAEVAFKYLDAKTKQSVLSYLNGISIEEASNWMDEMSEAGISNFCPSALNSTEPFLILVTLPSKVF